jgi:diguanylate cyclase (GGDEF)-like protein/putative nucleotidyltransferase with HDIG domain
MWILAPLHRLVDQVKTLAAKRGRVAGSRLAGSKGAEFAALGKEINHLLDELETTQTEIAQLYGQAREQADRDPVTGLLSRRAVFEGLERRLAAARERSGKLALLMIDIDGFKLFNDTYGHLAGDSVLRLVSREITARTREGDLAGRFGGDEILMVLTNTDTEGAIAQAGRLLDAANAITWIAPDGADVPVSLSVGVAAYPGHATELNELLAYADANLYVVKERGRRSVSAGGAAGVSGPTGYGFGMLDSLITALQEKDQYTRRHSEEVASIAVRMAEALSLDDRTLRAIRIAGLLHDVGKTGIPASLLMRPGHLTRQESDLMRRHVDIGLALIRDVPELDEVLAAVGAHHEHMDGSGYPRGIKGDRIPLSGRILAVADAYSAMMSFRPYRRAKTQEEAEQELRTMAGVTLDERLVEVFFSVCLPRPEAGAVTVERDDRALAPATRLAQEVI